MYPVLQSAGWCRAVHRRPAEGEEKKTDEKIISQSLGVESDVVVITAGCGVGWGVNAMHRVT
jgi:hypothetical protein